MASVSLAGVSKVFPGDVQALDRVHLEVQEGEFVVLVGPSGCGKTTLLRLVAGLERPSEGTIHIAGQVVNQRPPKERDVAMVFQGHALYPHLTVYRNLAFGLSLRKRGAWWSAAMGRLLGTAAARQNAAEIEEKVRSTARRLGIEDLLQRLPGELSGGQRQRVALGRALVRRPAVCLFDEPLSNLDAQLRAEMRRELKMLHQQQPATTLYVTHDQAEAMTLGSRIAVMRNGGIEQLGAPLELYDRPINRFVAGFLGSPSMNFLSGQLATIGDSINFVGRGGAIPLDKSAASRVQQYIGRRMWLGIRPEHVRLGSDPAAKAPSGSVLAVESLGDSCIVHLELEAFAERITAKTYVRVPANTGHRVPVEFDSQRLQLFDPDTGENVTIWA
jgi:multiple sugar transport system ATP-binding protein